MWKSWDRSKKLLFVGILLLTLYFLALVISLSISGRVLTRADARTIINLGLGEWENWGNGRSTTSVFIFIGATLEMMLYCYLFYRIFRDNTFNSMLVLTVALLASLVLCVSFAWTVGVRNGLVASHRPTLTMVSLLISDFLGGVGIICLLGSVFTHKAEPPYIAKEAL